jgi:CheY-like chemotaxis protein
MDMMVAGDLAPRNVLIIDDKTSQRKIIKRLLESQGYFVTALESPEEALYLLEYKDYPIIITDLRMPWMNGLEFCRRIRRIKPNALIYALSGHMDAFESRELIQAGFTGLFSKPVRIEFVRSIIDEDLKKIHIERSEVDEKEENKKPAL